MDHKLCRNCKGYCCDDIGLVVSPNELQNSYHNFMSWKDTRKRKDQMSMSHMNTDGHLWDYIWLTYPMLVFTHQDNIHPDGDTTSKSIIYHYSCKHHNKKTKDCDIYEERPMMCRTFPDNGFCGYKKVKIKEVIADRPEWFKFGLTNDDWVALRDGNDTREDKIIKRLDNISELLKEYDRPICEAEPDNKKL